MARKPAKAVSWDSLKLTYGDSLLEPRNTEQQVRVRIQRILLSVRVTCQLVFLPHVAGPTHLRRDPLEIHSRPTRRSRQVPRSKLRVDVACFRKPGVARSFREVGASARLAAASGVGSAGALQRARKPKRVPAVDQQSRSILYCHLSTAQQLISSSAPTQQHYSPLRDVLNERLHAPTPLHRLQDPVQVRRRLARIAASPDRVPRDLRTARRVS